MSAQELYLSNGVRSLPLGRSIVRIGRGDACEVKVSDPLASRHHCMISREPDGLTLRDLNSRNGTYLNGARVSSVALRAGDFIVVGRSGFVVEAQEHFSLWQRVQAFTAAQACARKCDTTLANELH